MSLKTVIAHILHPHDGSTFSKIELSLVQQGVAIAAADQGLVGTIERQIATVVGATGADRRTAVVNAVAADVLAFVADPSKVIADVIDFTHELVQVIFDRAKSTTAGDIASIIVARQPVTS
jgi:hypothetical protein